MAFVRKRKLYQMDFTGTGLEGLEVTMLGMSVEESLKLATLDELKDMKGAPTERELTMLRELFEFVASKVHSWNMVEEDGTSIPPSAREFMAMDAGDAFLMLDKWQDAVMAVPDPLERKSSDGNTSEALDLPPLPVPS
jgi:hypothetical protein